MGVPNFDGHWSSQPSIWKVSGIKQCAFALSLAHVINEVKREPVCPLAVYEIWAYWSSKSSTPRDFKLAVVWGYRPSIHVAPPKKVGADHEMMEQLIDSKEFWNVSACERDEGMIGFPFPSLENLLKREDMRFSLVYRDTRVEPLPGSRLSDHRLWRARRATLRSSAGEVSDLMRSLGAAFSYAALPMPSTSLTFSAMREVREQGIGLAIECLMACALREKESDAGIEYDFACRDAGQMAVEKGNAVLCSEYLQGFFMALGEHSQWSRVAGGGEQEVFFGLLCRIEPIWGESLDAMQRVRLTH
jgi:hypothetical protein